MKHLILSLTALILLMLCAETTYAQLTIYSGRSKALVEPMIQKFEKETGISVRVRYGGTTQLAVAIMEEGQRSPADLFWAQDAGALGELNRADFFSELPARVFETLPAQFKHADNAWVATSGRARVLAYNTRALTEADLPTSITELTSSKWRGKVGWAPSNASFQSFVTAMRQVHGEQATRQWLLDMKANGASAYNNNNSILQALAAGEIDLGLTNHYYLLRAKSTDPNYPVEQIFFEKGDAGNLVNVAGAGILKTSSRQSEAIAFIEFMLSEFAQRYFLSEVFEYPVVTGLDQENDELQQVLDLTPEIDLDDLRDLPGTLNLLRETGLL